MTLFRRLLRLELRETLRQPLTVAVFLLLFAAMLVAAAAGSARIERERATLAGIAVEQADAVRSTKDAARRYATPSDLKVEYHRDPTDAFGYMNYFLVTHAVKPPLPLGALATGQSDLQPYQIRIDFNSIFPDAAYDLDSPHELKLGAFDLAFVLVYLVPLGLIALAATRLTGEQDSGILRMIAAQPIPPRTVALAKYGALAIIAVTAVVGGALLASLVAGGAPASFDLAPVAGMLALWVVFWIAVAAFVATLWRGAVDSIAILVLIWAGVTILLPASAAIAVDLVHPGPSRIGYIDASRQAMDGFYGDETAVHAKWLARFPALASTAPTTVKSPEVKRFARDAYYRDALAPGRAAFIAHDQAVLALGDRLRLLSPAMMLDGTLQAVAGTDTRRHLAFVGAADAYGERLRRYFEPLALNNAAFPKRVCPQCPGRLNFTRHDEVPDFAAMIDEAAGRRAIGWTMLYLALLTGAVALLTGRRLREWPL